MARCHNIKKIADFSVINSTAVNHVGIAYLLVLNGRSGSIKLVSRRQEEGSGIAPRSTLYCINRHSELKVTVCRMSGD